MTNVPCSLPDIIPYDDILQARERIKDNVVRIPLLPLNVDCEYGKVSACCFFL